MRVYVALFSVVALVACKSPPASSGGAAASAVASAPAGAPVRLDVSDIDGEALLKVLEALSGKSSKVDGDAQAALKAARITIKNDGEIESKAAVKMIIEAFAAKGIELEEGNHRWKVHVAAR